MFRLSHSAFSRLRPGALASLALLIGSSFTNAPAADAPIAPLSPFGIGACNQTSQELPRWIPQMAAIDLHVIRSARVHWSEVEPRQGEWDWAKLDKQLDYLEQQGFTAGGLVYGNARWNTADKPGTLPVNNIEGWSRYVTELVKHCKARVKWWEVWNEPPNGTGKDQTPADYGKLVAATYNAAKAVDPTCLVGLTAKSAHINYLEQAIKGGARNHFDYISLHPYEILDTVADNKGTEAVFMHIVPNVRKMLAAQNPERLNVPIIFTELGTDARKGKDTQAHALVKAYSMGIAQGVACIQWFEGMDGDSGPMGLLERNGTPRPSYTAMGSLIKHLGQHPKYLGWVRLDGRNHGFVFEGAKGTVLSTWAPKGAPHRLDFGQSVQIVDPASGHASTVSSYELTAAPVLVLGVPDAIVKEAAANLNRPYLWDGDYSKAESVSITMGERNDEKGLHTMSGDAVAKAVVDYGGSARAGDVPGGNVFMVDPGFLSYTAEPIEITAVVRRNEQNQNAGFKLVYESTRGLKTSGTWYTVPDNKQWHTVKWRIDDPQFVSYWGYNFALESDGNQFNKYYIQSVTVRKVK